MGLTGHILEVEFQLERDRVAVDLAGERARAEPRRAARARCASAGRSWPFTVGWVDCLTRGPRARPRLPDRAARWATPDEAPPRGAGAARAHRGALRPCPSWAGLPRRRCASSTRSGTGCTRAPRAGVVAPETFFYPLDVIARLEPPLRPRGFTQYQCVLPPRRRPRRCRRLFDALRAHGGAVARRVIKDCGAEGRGLLSFPMPGISVALDMPIAARARRRWSTR